MARNNTLVPGAMMLTLFALAVLMVMMLAPTPAHLHLDAAGNLRTVHIQPMPELEVGRQALELSGITATAQNALRIYASAQEVAADAAMRPELSRHATERIAESIRRWTALLAIKWCNPTLLEVYSCPDETGPVWAVVCPGDGGLCAIAYVSQDSLRLITMYIAPYRYVATHRLAGCTPVSGIRFIWP